MVPAELYTPINGTDVMAHKPNQRLTQGESRRYHPDNGATPPTCISAFIAADTISWLQIIRQKQIKE